MLIVYITFVFFNQMQNLSRSVDSMSVSSRRLLELEKILSAVAANESSVRSYVITGDSLYLKERFRSQQFLEPNMLNLERLRASKSFSTDTLRSLLTKRYKLFSETLAAVHKNGPGKNVGLDTIMAQSDTVSDQIRNYIQRSLENEADDVAVYRINHNYEIDTSIITSFLLVTVALFILFLSLARISTDLRAMKKLNDELRFLNYTFNSAEKIAGISHWKYNLQTKSYSFSDNFYNQIGVDPEHFEPTLESVLPYIHEDDRDHVMTTYEESISKKTPTSLIYRLQPINGATKYIKSVGSFAENSHGELVKIGVNYDITDHYLNTANLEESNKHLRAINAELESFNNIVSHDLQEPLRKIQMFVSRIDEQESETLTEAGRDYFARITALANRMQNLLIDLVNYSRAMKGDKAFSKTDLKSVMTDVQQELSLNIDEQNAVIKIGNLPVINSIPAQIHQLLVNLVTNALKFTEPGVPPQVKVFESKIADDEIRDGIVFSPKEFVKIVVADKGIGFDQEFADKIFLLFRRLEKESYEGTGIGLAICKKIVENHNGYIFAESGAGKGATFIIYLPR
jgi:signal transduction histidine kinase/CHASE3 domain sensor protein